MRWIGKKKNKKNNAIWFFFSKFVATYVLPYIQTKAPLSFKIEYVFASLNVAKYSLRTHAFVQDFIWKDTSQCCCLQKRINAIWRHNQLKNVTTTIGKVTPTPSRYVKPLKMNNIDHAVCKSWLYIFNCMDMFNNLI